MGDLAGLIERLEKLEGPDQDIDLELARALVPDVICLRYNRETSNNEPFVHWRYTASIDDAFALAVRLLDNGSIDIECAYRVAAGQPLGRAYICGPHVESSAKAATPAIALLLALLRAMQKEERT